MVMIRLPQVTHRIPLSLLLALPVLAYLAVPLFWRARDIYVITGDEPHYLLIADSLMRDRDLRVLNNYKIETTPVQQAMKMKLYVPGQMGVHLYGEYSNHGIGLPLAISIPYFLTGVTGARVFLALVGGLWPLLIYLVLFQITQSRLWSIIVALTLGIGLPFSAA